MVWTVVAALVVAVARTAVEFLLARGDARRWEAELAGWQVKLGPLVFC